MQRQNHDRTESFRRDLRDLMRRAGQGHGQSVAAWLYPRKRGHTVHSKGFASSWAGPLAAERVESGVFHRSGLDLVNGPAGQVRAIDKAWQLGFTHESAGIPCTPKASPVRL